MTVLTHILAVAAVALNAGVTVAAIAYPHLAWLPVVSAAVTAMAAYGIPGVVRPSKP